MSHTFAYTFAYTFANGYGGAIFTTNATTKPAAESYTDFDAINATTKPAAESYTDVTADPSSDNMQPRDI